MVGLRMVSSWKEELKGLEKTRKFILKYKRNSNSEGKRSMKSNLQNSKSSLSWYSLVLFTYNCVHTCRSEKWESNFHWNMIFSPTKLESIITENSTGIFQGCTSASLCFCLNWIAKKIINFAFIIIYF